MYRRGESRAGAGSEIPVGLEPVSVRARTNDEVWVVNEVSDSVLDRVAEPRSGGRRPCGAG